MTDQPFSPEQRWIELGIPGAETRLVLFRFGDDLKPGGQMNITFWAEDVEETVRELKSKGVTIVMEPKKADWGTAAAFQDLDGNRFLISSR
jgi:predicted enzyme related to lactoylglutathione lyase